MRHLRGLSLRRQRGLRRRLAVHQEHTAQGFGWLPPAHGFRELDQPGLIIGREPIDGSGSSVSTGLSNRSPVRRCFVRYLTVLRTTRFLARTFQRLHAAQRPRSVASGFPIQRGPSVPLDWAMSAVL
jgi:hypothetical protein